MKSSFADITDVLKVNTEEAFSPVPKKVPENNLVAANCRVFGKPAVPVMVELNTRSVYPVKG